MKKRNVISLITVLLVGLLCTLYFYNQLIHTPIPIHSDDAGSAVDIRDIIENGVFDLSYWLTFSGQLNGILFYFFGASELFVQLGFCVKYFICIIISLYLALYNDKKMQWWLIPIFAFICMPGCFGTASIQPLKFHVWTIMFPLFCLAYYLARGNHISTLKKRDIFLTFVISLLGIIEQDILIFVTCWIPFALYWTIFAWQSGYIKKYIRQILTFGMILLIIGKSFFSMFKYNGYGANTFPDIESIFENVTTGISGILSMLNINIIGSDILQFNTIISGIRLIMLFFAIWTVGSRTKEIFENKLEDVSMVDAILTVSTYVVLIAYVFGGKREDDISIRYAAYLYYILLILVCRKLFEKINTKTVEVPFGRYKINLLSALFLVCIIVFADPITMNREDNDTDALADMIASTEKLNDGLGGFWSANVISTLTDYHNEVQAVSWNEDEVIPYLNEWDAYGDGSEYFNFFIEDTDNDFGITEEHIIELYGDYTEKYTVGDCNIFLYDYDIRTVPILIEPDSVIYLSDNDDLIVDGDVALIPSGQQMNVNNLYITSGTVRITVSGIFSQGDVELMTDQKADICIVSSSENECVYELTVENLYENFEFSILNNSKKMLQVESITLERVSNCIQLDNNLEYNMELTSGYYIFVLEGEKIKNSEIFFEMNGETIDAERTNNGRQKVAYGIEISEDGVLNVKVSSNGNIENVFYQNELQSKMENPNYSIYTIGDGILIHTNGDLLYGPYIDLEIGEYIVDIYGKNLDEASISFTYNSGEMYDNVEVIENDSNHCTYQINVQENISEFEVIISGIRDDNINCDYYTITYVDTESS